MLGTPEAERLTAVMQDIETRLLATHPAEVSQGDGGAMGTPVRATDASGGAGAGGARGGSGGGNASGNTGTDASSTQEENLKEANEEGETLDDVSAVNNDGDEEAVKEEKSTGHGSSSPKTAEELEMEALLDYDEEPDEKVCGLEAFAAVSLHAHIAHALLLHSHDTQD